MAALRLQTLRRWVVRRVLGHSLEKIRTWKGARSSAEWPLGPQEVWAFVLYILYQSFLLEYCGESHRMVLFLNVHPTAKASGVNIPYEA